MSTHEFTLKPFARHDVLELICNRSPLSNTDFFSVAFLIIFAFANLLAN